MSKEAVLAPEEDFKQSRRYSNSDLAPRLASDKTNVSAQFK
ncbi:MAG TPA: hypothetical protein VMV53_02470 [Acidimicrobiales bacterium]|nr:hypothetical protein [Acidimicrobiales bacterium]